MAKESDKKAKAKASRTEERRRERQTEQRRRTLLYGGIVLGGFLLLALITFLLGSAPVEAPIPDLARYDGIPVSRTTNGYSRLGSLDSTVRVSAYISLANSASRQFHADVFPSLLERVKSGEIALTYVLLDRVAEVTNFAGATRAAWCANEQGKFWGFIDAAYGWFDQFGTDAYSSNRLNSGAANLGLNTGTFSECLRSNRPNEMNTLAQTDAGGRDSTVVPPTVFVNDVVVTTDGDLLLAVNDAINRAQALRAGGTTATPEIETTTESTPDSTAVSTEAATSETTEAATLEPTNEPTAEPTLEPTVEPTTAPTDSPTATPSS